MNVITGTKHLETRLEQLLRYAEDAAQRAQGATSKLYGSDGRPKYAPHVEGQELAAIAERYAQEVAELLAEAESWRLQAESQRKMTRLDPFVLLDDSQLQRAGLLAPLAGLTVDVTPLPELAERLTAIAALADLPEKLVYLRAAERRAKTLGSNRIPGTLDGDPDGVRPSGDSGRPEFLQAVDHLRESAKHPKIVEAEQLAAALVQAATQVEIAVRRADPAAKRRREQAQAQQAQEFARQW